MSDQSKIPILIADDDPEDRLLIKDALEESRLVNELIFVKDGEELMARLQSSSPLPGLILLDLNMPGDGLEGARRLFLDFPAVKSVMLSTQDDEHIVSTALSAGAYGFLAKGIPTCELANALARIHAGQSEMSSVLAGRLLAQQGFGAPWRSLGETGILEITDREEQVLRRVAQGMTPDETGASIGLSGATVAAVLTNILLKLHEHDLLNHALARLPGDSTA